VRIKVSFDRLDGESGEERTPKMALKIIQPPWSWSSGFP